MWQCCHMVLRRSGMIVARGWRGVVGLTWRETGGPILNNNRIQRRAYALGRKGRGE